MLKLDRKILDKMQNDSAFLTEVISLLETLADEEVEKDDDEIDFAFIDECSLAIVEAYTGGSGVLRAAKLLTSEKLIKRAQPSVFKRLSTPAKAALIAAVLLASTLTVNAAINNSSSGKEEQTTLPETTAMMQETTEVATTQAATAIETTTGKLVLSDDSTYYAPQEELAYDDGLCVIVNKNDYYYGAKRVTYTKKEDARFDIVLHSQGLSDSAHGVIDSDDNIDYSKESDEYCCLSEDTFHRYEEAGLSAATLTEDGYINYRCYLCEHILSVQTPPKSVVLDRDTFIFDGHTHAPKVIAVLDSEGYEIPPEEYTIEFAALDPHSEGRHVHSSHCLEIVFDNSPYYEGVMTVEYATLPPYVNMDGIKADKGKIIPYWNKSSLFDAEFLTGFEIQYSTSSDFSNAKTVRVGSLNMTSKTIDGLSSGKMYYVRMRMSAYNYQKDKTFYGLWSEVRSVTVK